MENRRITFLIFILLTIATTVNGQQHHNLTMSLQEVIETAHSQSPSAILARHNFIVNYWQFRTYKAQFLPSLNLQGSLGNYNRSLVENLILFGY